MLKGVFKTPSGLYVEVFESNDQAPWNREDGWAVIPFADRVRIVCADGATPSSRTRPRAGISAARWATGVCISALHGNALAYECLWAAQEEIQGYPVDPSRHWRTYPRAALATVDIWPDGRVLAVRAGDCDVWQRKGDEWTPVLAGPMLTSQAQQLLDQAPGHQQFSASMEYEDLILSDANNWACHPIGAFEDPTWEQTQLPVFKELILHSDGVPMQAWIDAGEVYERLAEWEALGDSKDRTLLRVVRPEFAEAPSLLSLGSS